jgi:hypothetical protein
MIKAMKESIAPAIDPSNQTALEQAKVVAGSLDLIRQQIDYVHWFEAVDVLAHAALIDAFTEVDANSVSAAIRADAAAAKTLPVRWQCSLATLRDANNGLREAIAQLTADFAACEDADVRFRVAGIIIRHEEDQLSRERAFVAPTGFDVFPESLLPLEEVLEISGQFSIRAEQHN